jgi:exopolysaccharide biosynthesis polyprenyl glycosylphosphotransferase
MHQETTTAPGAATVSAVLPEVRSHPFKRRVASTLLADVFSLTLASLLAVRVASAVDDVAVLGRLIKPFEVDPQLGTTSAFVLLLPLWLAALWAFGLYRDPGRSLGGGKVLESLAGVTALTSTAWIVLIAMVLLRGDLAPVASLITFWALAVVLLPLSRAVTKALLWSRRSFSERVLIIGAGDVGDTVATKIARHPDYRAELVGFLDDGEPRRMKTPEGPHVPVLGSLGDLPRIIDERRVDRVIVAFSRARHNDFLKVVRVCADRGIQVNIVPRLFEVVSSRALVDDVEGIPLLDVGHVELGRFNMTVKRVFDLVVGGFMCIFALPVMAVLAVLIRLESPGPILFRQERMGRGGRTFMILKFRSMYEGAEHMRVDLEEQNEYSGPMFKIKRDPRVTRIGGWLRRWSLDEVPQILNVMKGDMSLVGPRPLWIEEAKQCRGWTQKRLGITPGMTGLWQVLGRSEIPFEEMVKLDYMYVTGWSLSWDVKLLLQTVGAVFDKRGAY